MPRTRRLFAATRSAVLLLAAASLAGPVRAQSRQLMNLDEVRQCLCQEQAINRRRDEFDFQRSLLRERQLELARLGTEIIRLTTMMKPNDAAAAAYLQRLRERQRTLQAQTPGTGWPEMKRMQDELSLLIEDYNQACTTRQRLRVTLLEAQRNLQCPQ